MSREETRFLGDIAARPLSGTVSRYQRLNLSRRKGNAVRKSLTEAGLIEAVPIPTRSGQVVLYQLTKAGRAACDAVGVDPGPEARESLEHRYWVKRTAQYFEGRGYEVTQEYQIKGNGAIDLVAERPGERIAVEVETGKSDITANLSKTHGAGFDSVTVVATSPAAVAACQRAIGNLQDPTQVSLLTWLGL
jgi:hypothetical protein